MEILCKETNKRKINSVNTLFNTLNKLQTPQRILQNIHYRMEECTLSQQSLEMTPQQPLLCTLANDTATLLDTIHTIYRDHTTVLHTLISSHENDINQLPQSAIHVQQSTIQKQTRIDTPCVSSAYAAFPNPNSLISITVVYVRIQRDLCQYTYVYILQNFLGWTICYI